MITRFEVKNFQGFEHLVYDFKSEKRYDFNTYLIKNKTINSSLIFGKNGSGKTILCYAIMDITYCITGISKNVLPGINYINASSRNNAAYFKYNFDFDGDKVEYEYAKSSQFIFQYEKLLINNKLTLFRNASNPSTNVINIKGMSSIDASSCSDLTSIITFSYLLHKFKEDDVIYKLVKFVNSMLLCNFNQALLNTDYIPFARTFSEKALIEKNKLSELQEFLKSFDINYQLIPLEDYNNNVIGVRFPNGKKIPLFDVASNGTLDLIVYFYYSTFFENSSFIIIDDFDSTYQYNIAKKIYKSISSLKNVQSVLTTHNLLLLDNDYTRPDCIFYLNNNQIKPFSSLCDVNIRKNNNLLKMYLDGKFNFNF